MLAVGLLLAAAAPASAAVYFGALIGGEPYGQEGDAPENEAAWDLFERHAGKKVAILNQDQPWCSFDQTAMNETAARGAIPLVTMGLPSGVTLAEVREGKQDAAIKQWAQAAKAWGRPFLLGPWWEMNGAWFSWGRSPEFVAAWRHFHDVVAGQGAANVTWTWIANAVWYDPESNPTPYYPGNEYVDWVGIDSYNWGLNPAQPDKWRNPDQTITPTLDIVDELTGGDKPVAIVEEASSEYGGNKADWIREMLTTYIPHHPEIQAYLWFNRNTERNEAHKDWMIETSVTAQQAFRRAVQSGIYVSAPVDLPKLTKVPPPPAASPAAPQGADLSGPAEVAAGPDVAVAADGTATVVWSARTGGSFVVYMRRIAADGSREPAVQLSDPAQDALAPQVAVAPDGTATVVWSRFDGSNFLVQGRRVDPEGIPEASTKNLSKTGKDAADPRVAIAPDGTATVVWKRFDGFHDRIEERRITPAGERLPAESTNLLSAEKQDAVEPAVASAPDGTSTVVWSRYDGSNSIVQERRIDPQGAPEEGAAEADDLSAEGENAQQPEVAAAPDGEATVVWTRFDGSHWLIQGQRLDPEGALDGAVANLSASGRDAAEPELAIDAEGRATVVWERYDGSNFVVQARRLDPAGVPAGVQNLSAGGRDAAEPQLALDPDGAATVVWSRFDGANFVIQRRDVAVDGSLSTVEGVSAPGQRASAPAAARGSDGVLAMVWRRFAGSGDAIQTATPPPPPPPPPPGGKEPESEGGAGSTPSPGGSAVAAFFQIDKVIVNRRNGTATLKVSTSGPGLLALTGAVPRSQTLDAAGATALRVVPKPAKRRLLSRRGVLRLKVIVSFEPRGGSPVSRQLTLGLRKARSRTG